MPAPTAPKDPPPYITRSYTSGFLQRQMELRHNDLRSRLMIYSRFHHFGLLLGSSFGRPTVVMSKHLN
jgi:hypothetical protein